MKINIQNTSFCRTIELTNGLQQIQCTLSSILLNLSYYLLNELTFSIVVAKCQHILIKKVSSVIQKSRGKSDADISFIALTTFC